MFSGPEIINLFSCSTQLSMKFFLLVNVKMPTIVGILTFGSGETYEHLKWKKFYNLRPRFWPLLLSRIINTKIKQHLNITLTKIILFSKNNGDAAVKYMYIVRIKYWFFLIKVRRLKF